MPEDQQPTEREIADGREYLRRSNLVFLECAISLMASYWSPAEVAEILEKEAQLLRELG